MKKRIIGLTGGIGSGKSTVAAQLGRRGLAVLDADAIAGEALHPNSPCYPQLVELFGRSVVGRDGCLNRREIARRIFADAEYRRAMNEIVHPYVLQRMQILTEEALDHFVVWDVPLLFESGWDVYCDETVTVSASEDHRIQRIRLRDGCTEADARARIACQLSDREREALADTVLHNNGTKEELFREIGAYVIRLERKYGI